MTVELRKTAAKTLYMLTEIAVGDKFNIPFKYLGFDENLKVGIRGQAEEGYRELVLDEDYYITSSDGTNGVWGVVTFKTGHTGLQSLVIYRDIPITQEKKFNSQTIFASTTESALDKLTMIMQDKEYENRILRAAIDDTVSEGDLILPIGESGYLYTDESGAIRVGKIEAAQKALRQPDEEEANETFIIREEERQGKILAFGDNGNVKFIEKYRAGENIEISESNVISAVNTTYVAGENIQISEDHEISARDTTYTAGKNIEISEGNVISAVNTTKEYEAGDGIKIEENVLSCDLKIADVTSWKEASMPSTASWNSVCYGNGKFVAVAFSSAKAAYSTDGITWTATSMPSTAEWRSVCYGNGKFVAVASSSTKAAYSTDGIAWTAATLPNSAYWRSVCYGDGRFVAVAYESDRAAYSTDGITWHETTLPSSAYWISVCYGDGKFVAVAESAATAAYSFDGITWTAATLPSTAEWRSVCYGNGKFVAVASSSTEAAYSTDGINWTETTLPETANWFSVCYGNGKFVAVAFLSAKTAYSFDGITWKAASLPETANWCSVCYGNGKFVAVARVSGKSAYTESHSIYEMLG